MELFDEDTDRHRGQNKWITLNPLLDKRSVHVV